LNVITLSDDEKELVSLFHPAPKKLARFQIASDELIQSEFVNLHAKQKMIIVLN
jgi:hypothetical protein